MTLMPRPGELYNIAPHYPPQCSLTGIKYPSIIGMLIITRLPSMYCGYMYRVRPRTTHLLQIFSNGFSTCIS